MTDAVIPIHAIKGRGTATRMPHRFEKDVRSAWDDGWDTLQDAASADAPRVILIPIRNTINYPVPSCD